jgi:hypothetical protein
MKKEKDSEKNIDPKDISIQMKNESEESSMEVPKKG